MEQDTFVGRRLYLERLRAHLDAVVADGRGRMLAVRGRRQCGKSRLVSRFVAKAKLPAFYFTGSRQATVAADLQSFVADAAERSTLPGRDAFAGAVMPGWEAALRMVANALPKSGPAIVVIDELPWLLERDPGLEGTLQKLWDTVFQHLPVLLILVGSDLSMMEALQTHGRPLFGRPHEMVVEPFHVADVASMLGLDDPASAFDAWLVTGGYPRLLLEWRRSQSLGRFLDAQLRDENSDLMVIGARVLAAEFPFEVQARHVLSNLGSGERSFTALQSLAGIRAAALQRSLELLRTQKRLVEVDLPLSTRPSRESRYRVADPYLRFWLRFLEPSAADIARGRPDLARARFDRDWTTFRGRAIEPVVRTSVLRLCAGHREFADVGAVGGYWTRTNDVEVDLVGADRVGTARRVVFVGSIKWRERSPFARPDLDALLHNRARVPGGGAAKVVAVARAGATVRGLDASFSPEDLLVAWK
ncbi:MAG: ATPase [Planctomycetes bacterium]|nr:ATPase [Planctomycetota bacterium]